MAQNRFVLEVFNSAGVNLTAQAQDFYFATDAITAGVAAVGSNNVSTYRVCDAWACGMVIAPVPGSASVDTTGLHQISDKTIVQNQTRNNLGVTSDFNV